MNETLAGADAIEQTPPHQPDQVNTRGVVRVGLGLALVVIVAMYGMSALFRGFHRPYPVGQEDRLLEPSGVVATGAYLDANQSAQLRELRRAHFRILTSYDWIDRANEIARIPIDRAMDLMLEEELPARSETP